MKKKLTALFLVSLFVCIAAVWVAGGMLASAAPANLGALPPDLIGRDVQISSQSGAILKGWSAPRDNRKGAIILMHGVRSNRESMLERARFLSRQGHSVLLFDFQAHGESTGRKITFGYLESRDAAAAVDFVRKQQPQEKIGIIGVSLGGAASLLATPPLEVHAMVLESVYPTIEEAVGDRLTMRLGDWAGILTPLLTLQLKPRIGVGVEALKPIEAVKTLSTPKLFLFGTEDRHTRLEESRRLVSAASEPKESWEIPGAGHVDLCDFAKTEYQSRILAFFSRYLQ